MQDHTPTSLNDTIEYAPWVAMFGLRQPYGLCQCGCGKVAPISPRSAPRFGCLVGYPSRYIRNHHTRVQPSQAPWVEMFGMTQPYGKCQCGCGDDTPIAKCTRKPIGIQQGQPTRFIHSHGGRENQFQDEPLEDRFWKYARKGASANDCWTWIGFVDGDGYARLTSKEHGNHAHRVSYSLHIGHIPSGLLVCHRCDNPPCTNPAHLFLGTTQDNTADMVRKKRHQYGERHNKHKLTEANVKRIRELGATAMTHQAIADLFGVSESTIGNVLLRRTWAHVP